MIWRVILLWWLGTMGALGHCAFNGTKLYGPDVNGVYGGLNGLGGLDGLGRVVSKTDRDGATTAYAYDPAGNQTNRLLPGGLQWRAVFSPASQLLYELNTGTNTVGYAQSNSYTYYAGGSPFAGLLATRTDGRGVTCTPTYDNWLRYATNAYAGSLSEQNLSTIYQYEVRGYLTNLAEQFVNSTNGPATSVIRQYDPYGQLASESVNGGPAVYGDTQTWDAAGRRTQLSYGGATNYGFAWRSDYTMAAFLAPNGSGLYGFDTAGLLTNRTVTVRATTITARDGEGRPLLIATTVNGATNLVESLAWLGDGLLASHTLVRRDFTDSRSYNYANLSRRLTREQLNLNATNLWTNNFAYDGGAPGGPGVLTSAGQTNAQWSGGADAFSRLTQATNTTVGCSASGHVTGLGTVNLWLDGSPVSVLNVGATTMQWNATMELSPGTHQLVGSAVEQPAAQFTAWATNYFTNSIPYQTTSDTLDLAGNTTQRVWLNANGTTNRVQTFSWDARGRLHAITERDATNSGYNWTAVYDALNRRLSTTAVLVTNGYAFTAQPNSINQTYDPQTDGLELGLAYGGKSIWKLYGPDLNGVYGGLNGRGGFDGYTTALGLFLPTICDFRGNVLGYVTNGAVVWIPARPTAYGAVPGCRPVALGNGANVPQSSAWGGLWPDITGYYNFHQRVYDPITGHWLSGDPEWNERDPNWYTYCGGDPVNHTDRDGKLSANNYSSNPGQGLGGDNGTLNQYFGFVAGTQTTIQTTAHLDNGNSFVLGTDQLYDPSTVLGYTAQANTTLTGQTYLYSGSQPLPDNAGQASTVQLPLGAMMEQQANTLALQDLAMIPIILDGGEALLGGGAADSGGAFANYMQQAQTLDVSTAPNTAVFYSGPGNRALAEQFADQNGMFTLEKTPGGSWLDQQGLFNPGSPLTRDQAGQVWSTLSQRFAQGASGNTFGFVNGARAGSIFNTVEYPTLLNNPGVVNVITGGH